MPWQERKAEPISPLNQIRPAPLVAPLGDRQHDQNQERYLRPLMAQISPRSRPSLLLCLPLSGVSLFGDFERAAGFNAEVTDHARIRLVTAEGRVPASFASTSGAEWA